MTTIINTSIIFKEGLLLYLLPRLSTPYIYYLNRFEREPFHLMHHLKRHTAIVSHMTECRLSSKTREGNVSNTTKSKGAEERIYVLLVNRKGEVLWRVEGSFNEEKGRDIELVLEGQQFGTTR